MKNMVFSFKKEVFRPGSRWVYRLFQGLYAARNLFNDTLMAQRVAKKDLSTRFYIQIADTLRQKFSFDFYNPMVVQKCIATTQALLNNRDVAPRRLLGGGVDMLRRWLEMQALGRRIAL